MIIALIARQILAYAIVTVMMDAMTIVTLMDTATFEEPKNQSDT